MYRLQLMAMNAVDRVQMRLRDQRGQGTMEYILIIAILVIGVMALLWAFKDTLQSWLDYAKGKVDTWKV